MLVAQFAAGLIVGILLGLALAPVLRAWMVWQIAKEARDAHSPSAGADKSAAKTER